MRIAALQRLVVRMTIDPSFAEAVLSGRIDPGLDAEGLRWLLAVDRRAWGAELGRGAQMLGNLAAEYPLAVRLADDRAVESFTASSDFHQAIASDASLPLAFGEHLLGRAAPRALAPTLLELEMARSRRLRPPQPAAPVRTAPGVRLIRLPAGTVRWASEAAAASAAGRRWTDPPPPGEDEVAVLAPRVTSRWRVPEVRVEVAHGAVLALVTAARVGLSSSDLIGFAASYEASREELRDVIGDLVRDGILDPAAVGV